MTYLLILLAVFAAFPLGIEARRKPMSAAARQDASGDFVTLSQGVTHYEWLGPARGPVAVCVHGLTTPSFVWRGLARGLARMGFRVLIYDLYGRGYSDRVQGRQDRVFFLRQLNDLLADQQVNGDITLVGYSMGGGDRHYVCLGPSRQGAPSDIAGLGRYGNQGWRSNPAYRQDSGDR